MRVDDLEFRRNGLSNAEIVRWQVQGEKEFCYTLLWFKKDDEGYYIEFVGARPLEIEDRGTLWKLMDYGQAVLTAEYKLWD